MKRILLTLIAGLALCIGGCSTPAATGSGGAAESGKPAPYGYLYVCNCGPECNCGSSANLPGKCSCGKPMVLKKVLVQDPVNNYICGCKDCACDKLNPANPSQCSCGKALKSFPKSGAYSCGCPDCPCNMQSRNPGKCICGKELKAK